MPNKLTENQLRQPVFAGERERCQRRLNPDPLWSMSPIES
jgi:hypothetical protein